MKRWVLYIGILALLLISPAEPMEIEQLIPVQTVFVSQEDHWIVMETDTGNVGIGGTAKQALQNLKDTTAGMLYLDKVQYLLLTEQTLNAAEELREAWSGSVKLCVTTGKTDLMEAAKYLDAHGKLPKLKAWKTDQELPVLSTFGDSYIFLKKVENNA